ncbi:MAG: NOB1 family endonuclease [Candidatus Thermoplasmatota archaeon]|nr:NOB1 family endonuclease [Candidatus Thermoplasmatota archaeon]
MKKQVFIIDTSAILSGKPIQLNNRCMMTTPGVSDELRPGGRDYQIFEFLKETGLVIHAPSKEALAHVKATAHQTGDDARLSTADIEILALAYDVNREPETEAVILTDDYSIQNLAATLHIVFQGFSQKEITKKFKWVSRCPGCERRFQEPTKICPVCGTRTKSALRRQQDL